MKRPARSIRAAIAVAALAAAGPAWGTLGEEASTVERDVHALAMERRPAEARGDVTVHELRGPTTTVREFVAPSGRVFAVTWSGIARPDLTPLLGAYEPEYRAAAAATRRRGRGPRRVEAGRVVVETWGHARSLHGRAYVPALVPAGTDVHELE